MTPALLKEISNKTLVYHRSSHPMKIGDIIVSKKNPESKKHWMESVEAEIGLELYRRDEFSNKPSRLNCIYSSIIPRSRFSYKGNLYVVRPYGKVHVGDSAIIDKLIQDFEHSVRGMTGNYEYADRVNKQIKDNPQKALDYLNYNLADLYWRGKAFGGNLRAAKKNIEVLSDSAEVVEFIADRENDIRAGEEYEVTEDDKLFAWLTPSNDVMDEEWNRLNQKIQNHLFSTLDKAKKIRDYDSMGYLRKGVKVKPREVRLTSMKSQDDIINPEQDDSKGKYSRMSMGFEMEGKWYMPYKDKYYTFDLVMASHLRHYHKQPYDFGQYLRKI
jgi:hypothetical protein